MALAAALVPTAVASAALQPVQRNRGDIQIPRVRAGTLTIPSGHARGLVTVLVTLHAPPLAASHGRTLAAALGARRLDVRSAGSREYLAKLARLQARDAASFIGRFRRLRSAGSSG